MENFAEIQQGMYLIGVVQNQIVAVITLKTIKKMALEMGREQEKRRGETGTTQVMAQIRSQNRSNAGITP